MTFMQSVTRGDIAWVQSQTVRDSGGSHAHQSVIRRERLRGDGVIALVRRFCRRCCAVEDL